VRFPGRSGWNASAAEEDFGNLAIRRSGKMTVESTKSKDELLTLQARERIGRAVRLASQQSPETQRGISASGKIRVKRDDCGERRVNLDCAHRQERESTLRVGDDPMFALI
jgi:hypothetical protein